MIDLLFILIVFLFEAVGSIVSGIFAVLAFILSIIFEIAIMIAEVIHNNFKAVSIFVCAVASVFGLAYLVGKNMSWLSSIDWGWFTRPL